MAAPLGNKFAEGLQNSGRPPIFKSVKELKEKINEYFDNSLPEEIKDDETGDVSIKYPRPLTITGLCLYLGFESRQSFYAYEQKEEFSYTIRRDRKSVV